MPTNESNQTLERTRKTDRWATAQQIPKPIPDDIWAACGKLTKRRYTRCQRVNSRLTKSIILDLVSLKIVVLASPVQRGEQAAIISSLRGGGVMQDSTLPQLVQETRKERGLSQRELAKLVGASAVLVSKIENKRRSVEPELLSRIAVATGYPVAWYSDPSTRSNPLPQLSWMLDRQGKVVHFYGALELVSRAEAFGSTLDDWSDRFPDVVNLHKQVQPGECSGQIANVFGRRFYIVVARQSTYPYYCYGTAILLLV